MLDIMRATFLLALILIFGSLRESVDNQKYRMQLSKAETFVKYRASREESKFEICEICKDTILLCHFNDANNLRCLSPSIGCENPGCKRIPFIALARIRARVEMIQLRNSECKVM